MHIWKSQFTDRFTRGSMYVPGPISKETRYIWYDTWYDIFVNCSWIHTLWQWYSTHLHTNHT